MLKLIFVFLSFANAETYVVKCADNPENLCKIETNFIPEGSLGKAPLDGGEAAHEKDLVIIQGKAIYSPELKAERLEAEAAAAAAQAEADAIDQAEAEAAAAAEAERIQELKLKCELTVNKDVCIFIFGG